MMESRKKNSASAYLLFFVLILTVAAAAVLLLPVYRDYQKKKAEEEKLREELADRKETSAALNSEVAGLRNDPEEIEKGDAPRRTASKPKTSRSASSGAGDLLPEPAEITSQYRRGNENPVGRQQIQIFHDHFPVRLPFPEERSGLCYQSNNISSRFLFYNFCGVFPVWFRKVFLTDGDRKRLCSFCYE